MQKKNYNARAKQEVGYLITSFREKCGATTELIFQQFQNYWQRPILWKVVPVPARFNEIREIRGDRGFNNTHE